MNEMYIISFNSTHQAIKCDKVFGQNSTIKHAVLPTPREITKSCGISIKFLIEDLSVVKEILNENEIEYKGIFKVSKQEDGSKKIEEVQ